MIIKQSGTAVGVTTTQYASGDLMGNKLTLTGANFTNPAAALVALAVQDLTAQSGALDVIIFDADPTGTTFTENAALDIADADLPKIIGIIKVVAGDYSAFADNSFGFVKGLDIMANAAAGSALYAACVSRDTKTYGANELSLAFHFVE